MFALAIRYLWIMCRAILRDIITYRCCRIFVHLYEEHSISNRMCTVCSVQWPNAQCLFVEQKRNIFVFTELQDRYDDDQDRYDRHYAHPTQRGQYSEQRRQGGDYYEQPAGRQYNPAPRRGMSAMCIMDVGNIGNHAAFILDHIVLVKTKRFFGVSMCGSVLEHQTTDDFFFMEALQLDIRVTLAGKMKTISPILILQSPDLMTAPETILMMRSQTQ